MIPENVRERFWYVIVMPLNDNGHGPASEELGEVRKLTWEVWNQVLESDSSWEFLPDAIQRCEELNKEYYGR